MQVLDDRLTGRAEVHRRRAALAPVQHVEADVRGDPVEPRAECGAAFEAVVRAPRPQERLLHRVLGLERRGEHAIAVGDQLAPVLLELELQLGGGGLGRERRLLHHVMVRTATRSRLEVLEPVEMHAQDTCRRSGHASAGTRLGRDEPQVAALVAEVIADVERLGNGRQERFERVRVELGSPLGPHRGDHLLDR